MNPEEKHQERLKSGSIAFAFGVILMFTDFIPSWRLVTSSVQCVFFIATIVLVFPTLKSARAHIRILAAMISVGSFVFVCQAVDLIFHYLK